MVVGGQVSPTGSLSCLGDLKWEGGCVGQLGQCREVGHEGVREKNSSVVT